MRILQVSTTDISGGAERVAHNLFQGYRARGHESWLAVGQKHSDDPDTFTIPNKELRYHSKWSGFWHSIDTHLQPYHYRVRGTSRLSHTAQTLAEPLRAWQQWRGIEDFNFPGTQQLLSLPPHHPDILHCHNLHGGYFDLRELRHLSKKIPTVFTLHDAWLLSGHCSHSFECERWKSGCGHCPDLTIYPAVRQDTTAYNWQRKKSIYEQSRLHISTPSHWLMNKVEQSMLMPAETRIIPYGVDLDIFKPYDKNEARATLNLPYDARILLFSAASIRRNQFKDYATMREAVRRLGNSGQHALFLALGEEAPPEKIGTAEIRFIPYHADPSNIALFYQTADIYLHAARADTFPNAVLEALACGTPVIASTVGGIPEQITNLSDGVQNPTGVLIQDAEDMANAAMRLLNDDSLHKQMSENAAQDARRRFDLQTQIQTHLDWYTEILAREKNASIA